jgi:hypothetical protein
MIRRTLFSRQNSRSTADMIAAAAPRNSSHWANKYPQRAQAHPKPSANHINFRIGHTSLKEEWRRLSGSAIL